MKPTAHYHQSGREPIELAVLKKNDDGTVDLGTAAGSTVVAACPVADKPTSGHATLVDDKAAAKSRADEAAAKALADEQAEKALADEADAKALPDEAAAKAAANKDGKHK